MKAYELQGPSGIDGLALVDKPMPSPGPRQVLVRLTAATLNYRDLLTVRGGYGSRQKFPLIPLSDGAGVVEAVGEGVRHLKAGDRVIGSFFEEWLGGELTEQKAHSALGGALDGVLCEYRVFPAHALVKTPGSLTDIEAAALPCAGLTAWSAVVKFGRITPGQTVLTQGTGGVSLFALQFAKLCGARVIATSSSEAKIERLKAMGADITFNYKTTPDWGKRAREATGRGVDLVVEVGGVGTLNEFDPRHEDRRDDRLHRRARGQAGRAIPPAADGDAAAAASGHDGRVHRGFAGDDRRHRAECDEAGDRQGLSLRAGERRLCLYGERRAFRESGDRDRVTHANDAHGGRDPATNPVPLASQAMVSLHRSKRGTS